MKYFYINLHLKCFLKRSKDRLFMTITTLYHYFRSLCELSVIVFGPVPSEKYFGPKQSPQSSHNDLKKDGAVTCSYYCLNIAYHTGSEIRGESENPFSQRFPQSHQRESKEILAKFWRNCGIQPTLAHSY